MTHDHGPWDLKSYSQYSTTGSKEGLRESSEPAYPTRLAWSESLSTSALPSRALASPTQDFWSFPCGQGHSQTFEQPP